MTPNRLQLPISRAFAFSSSCALPLGLLVVFFCGAVFSLIAYGYYLNSAVEYASLRVSSEEDRAQLSGVVAILESERAALVASLTLERARELGLIEVAYPIFLTRGVGKELSFVSGIDGP